VNLWSFRSLGEETPEEHFKTDFSEALEIPAPIPI
jgi:hypothetical protein